jgi:hypothetical protein
LLFNLPFKAKEFIPPTLKRGTEIVSVLCALCCPSKTALPDTYSLFSQELVNLGVASISSLELSLELRKTNSVPVEVKWLEKFNKYQILRIMPKETPITTASFFYHKKD